MNNIFHTSEDRPGGTSRSYIWVQTGTSLTGWTIDYNDYYVDKASSFILSATAKTLAQWRAATGKDAHSIALNPLFANAAGGDFHVQSGSPCIGAGAVISGVGQQGTKPNIGAY